MDCPDGSWSLSPPPQPTTPVWASLFILFLQSEFTPHSGKGTQRSVPFPVVKPCHCAQACFSCGQPPQQRRWSSSWSNNCVCFQIITNRCQGWSAECPGTFSQRRSCFGLSLKTDMYMLVGKGISFFTENVSLASKMKRKQSGRAGPGTLAPTAIGVSMMPG